MRNTKETGVAGEDSMRERMVEGEVRGVAGGSCRVQAIGKTLALTE